MGTEGSVYQRKDRRWVAQYTDAKGKTRYLYRKTKGETKQALREALKDRDDIKKGYEECDSEDQCVEQLPANANRSMTSKHLPPRLLGGWRIWRLGICTYSKRAAGEAR